MLTVPKMLPNTGTSHVLTATSDMDTDIIDTDIMEQGDQVEGDSVDDNDTHQEIVESVAVDISDSVKIEDEQQEEEVINEENLIEDNDDEVDEDKEPSLNEKEDEALDTKSVENCSSEPTEGQEEYVEAENEEGLCHFLLYIGFFQANKLTVLYLFHLNINRIYSIFHFLWTPSNSLEYDVLLYVVCDVKCQTDGHL